MVSVVTQDHPRSVSSNYSIRHIYMVLSEIITLIIYAVSMTFLQEYFGESRSPCGTTQCSQPPRSVVRLVFTVRLEGCGHCGHQRIPTVHYQVHP